MFRVGVSAFLFLTCMLQLLMIRVSAIPLDDFYPFGTDAGDDTVGPTLDGSSPARTLSRPFPFFSNDHLTIYVNNNGHITFTGAFDAFQPLPFPIVTEMIAPLWADVDTRPIGGGTVWYREATEQADLNRAQQEIRDIFPEVGNFVARLVFIATWDHVGYFNMHTDKTNTFQCILVTDSIMSYAIFLYADGLIQWTTGDDSGGFLGLGGTPAQVGYNSEGGQNYTTHPFSFTADILTLDSSSVPEDRVTVGGMVVYRVDAQLESQACEEGELTIFPRISNLLGGVPLIIRGLCFEPDGDFVVCGIEGQRNTVGEIVDRNTAVCTTPLMNTLGNVEVQVRRVGVSERTIVSTTITTVAPTRAHQVGFSIQNAPDDMQLYFRPDDVVTLTWAPSEVIQTYLSANTFRVDIEMLQQRDVVPSTSTDPRWVPIDGTLISNVENSGTFDYTIPAGLIMNACAGQTDLCPVVFHITAVEGTRANVTSGAEDIELPTSAGGYRVGIWSSVGYLQNSTDIVPAGLSQTCEDWTNLDSTEIQMSRLRGLPSCPPTQAQAEVDVQFRREEMSSIVGDTDTGYREAAMKFFYPDSSVCYVQVTMTGSSGTEGTQCCYDSAGNLVLGQPGGGSVDKTSPLVDFNMHNMNDMLPFAFCCRGGLRCGQYDEQRPSNNMQAQPFVLIPPACVFGDPHIVTLDGFKYTFNGKGEFVLVETHDNSFTLQGRMEQPLDSNNQMAPGTVFTAIVAHQVGPVPRTVEFQVSEEDAGLDVLVNGTEVNFENLPEQDFQHVVVIDRGNETVVAEFSGGFNIEIRVDNGIVSVMLVSLPSQYRSLTAGLMGNYNGDDNDDLIPRSSTASISADSSMEQIFEFGSTWIIDDAADSHFAYNVPGHSFEFFRDPSFTPAFEPEFSDPELEQKADEICGDDPFCRFDIAATGNEDIGAATMQGVMDFDEIVVLAEPIVCEPPCENGVCVATDSCSCAVGYSGERCTERLESECETDMCQNNGTCVQHVQSFTCECPEGFIGIFCQEKEPPLSVKLINGSPRVSDKAIAAEFLSSKPLTSATCTLFNITQVDCSKGYVRFEDVPPGFHRLIIRAEATTWETAEERRTIFLCDRESSSCGATLINEGVVVTGDCARVQFQECGKVDSTRCQLDDGPFIPCLSPVQYCGLKLGEHSFRVQPFGKDCGEINRQSIQFNVI